MSIHICTYFSFLQVAFQGLVKASKLWALALKWLMAFPAFKFCCNTFFTFWPNKIFSMVSFWSFLSQTLFCVPNYIQIFLLFFWPLCSFPSSSSYDNYLFVPYRHFPSMPWIFSFSHMGFVLFPRCNIFLWISACYNFQSFS